MMSKGRSRRRALSAESRGIEVHRTGVGALRGPGVPVVVAGQHDMFPSQRRDVPEQGRVRQSITPDPVTACASFASTGSDAHSRSCSKPSTASKPTAFTWSASRSASTPRRRPASSCSTSSASSRTSSAGSSPSEPATALPRPGKRGRTPGRPPLDPETVSAAQKLIEAGLSPGQAAKQLGIGWATAYRIAKTMR